jgi:hypothetical protein
MEQLKYPSSDGWIKKCGHIHNKILFSHNKERNLVICDMIGTGDHYAK